MNTSLATLAVIAGAYLVGSVAFAVVVSKLFGLPDPYSYGSGNPGATNVLRTGNKAAAALTLAGDCIKGFLAVWLAQHLGASWGDAALATAGAAVAVFLGHLYPVFHRFKGGKGVATAAGVAFALAVWLGVALLGVWLAFALLFRISSLASIAAAVAAPPLGLYFLGNGPEAWALFPIALFLLWRHRDNIRKLLVGQERKIGR
ncbi:MAG TPA: glycerol-3-phosphate 1-O-acyltransferase PlsY [Casimicrobiaceae bacterium]|nr:glycerol-3-phosphate 1-O-acyltransferase PlsY [Casimicrobiaceae bacterium]